MKNRKILNNFNYNGSLEVENEFHQYKNQSLKNNLNGFKSYYLFLKYKHIRITPDFMFNRGFMKSEWQNMRGYDIFIYITHTVFSKGLTIGNCYVLDFTTKNGFIISNSIVYDVTSREILK